MRWRRRRSGDTGHDFKSLPDELKPREKMARRGTARGMAAKDLVAHNHPSGDTTPSAGDFRLTDEREAAGQVLSIPVLDHLVLGRDTFASAMRGRE